MEKKTRENIAIVIAVVGLIITIIALYLQFRKKVPPDNGEPPVEPPEEEEVGEVPGRPDVWEYHIKQAPGEIISVHFPEPLHIATISGQFHVINTCPGCWLKKNIGVRGYVTDSVGQTYLVFKDEPGNGFGPGWRAFSAVVGLSDIEWIYVEISRVYGFGDEVHKLDEIIGEAVVVI